VTAERWLCAACGASTEPAPEPPPGCPRCDAPLHVGKYGLLAELPAERSARVFRGRQSSGRAEVTVRLFPGDILPSLPQIRDAVKKASKLDHPTIAAPLDAGAHQNRVYVVEPWVPGEPVLLCELTLREAAGVVHDAAVALGHAEDRGIVHPDLRPENLRVRRVPGKGLGESGLEVLVTCFGIAEGGNARRNVRMLGTVLFTLATGRAPRGSSPESPSALNPLVGSELESIILMALESNPSRQPPSAHQIAHDLQQYLDGRTKGRPEPVLKPGQAKKPVRPRIPPRAAALAAAAAAILIGLVVFVTRHREPPLEVPVTRAGRMPTEPPPPPPKSPLEPAPKPPKPINPVQPAEPVKIVEPPKPAEPVKPPPEPPKPINPVQPAEPVKIVEAPKPAEPIKPPPEPPKPINPVQPAEPAKIVEAPKPAEPVKPPSKPPPAPPPAGRGSVGRVQGVHPEYGVFVKLDAGGKVAAGEILEVVRKEEAVARLRVERVTAPEKLYPNGCAICKAEQGEPAQGDSVRRVAR
jgi:hypothetical protein